MVIQEAGTFSEPGYFLKTVRVSFLSILIQQLIPYFVLFTLISVTRTQVVDSTHSIIIKEEEKVIQIFIINSKTKKTSERKN